MGIQYFLQCRDKISGIQIRWDKGLSCMTKDVIFKDSNEYDAMFVFYTKVILLHDCAQLKTKQNYQNNGHLKKTKQLYINFMAVSCV